MHRGSPRYIGTGSPVSHPAPARPPRGTARVTQAAFGLPEVAAFVAGAGAPVVGLWAGALTQAALRTEGQMLTPQALNNIIAGAGVGALLAPALVVTGARAAQGALPGHGNLAAVALFGAVASLAVQLQQGMRDR